MQSGKRGDTRMKIASRTLLTLCFAVLCCWAPLSLAQTPAATPAAVPKAVTDADVAGAPVPSADARSKGDPDGSLTGTASDVAVGDAKKGLTIGDLVNQVGQNKIAINFTWTLICGFLVMFMQAGFALVETGLVRGKNAAHTMSMNFMIYAIGMFGFFICGFAFMCGGANGTNIGGPGQLGGVPTLDTMVTVGAPVEYNGAKDNGWGIIGNTGYFLSGKSPV